MSAERQLRNDASMPMEEAEDNDVVHLFGRRGLCHDQRVATDDCAGAPEMYIYMQNVVLY